MVRTKADAGSSKAVGAKAPRKNFAAPSASSSEGNKGRDYSGGNAYCPRETPGWQKPITSFFAKPTGGSKDSSTEEKPVNINQKSTAGNSATKEDVTG